VWDRSMAIGGGDGAAHLVEVGESVMPGRRAGRRPVAADVRPRCAPYNESAQRESVAYRRRDERVTASRPVRAGIPGRWTFSLIDRRERREDER
jgi:hypothetical protein